MIGDDVELKWNRKDRESLDVVLVDHCKGRRQAVQAGGCYGVFANRLAEAGFESVYVFEPDPNLFRAMVGNVTSPAVIMMQAALGYERKLVQTVLELRPNDGKTVLHPGMTRTEPGGIIPTLRIDDLGLAECDLIYLDIEGDEMAAIMGARETIARCKPAVVLEVNRGLTYRGYTPEDVYTGMRMCGYVHVASYRSDVVFRPRVMG